MESDSRHVATKVSARQLFKAGHEEAKKKEKKERDRNVLCLPSIGEGQNGENCAVPLLQIAEQRGGRTAT